jgi:hypothetical protein
LRLCAKKNVTRIRFVFAMNYLRQKDTGGKGEISKDKKRLRLGKM